MKSEQESRRTASSSRGEGREKTKRQLRRNRRERKTEADFEDREEQIGSDPAGKTKASKAKLIHVDAQIGAEEISAGRPTWC
jgi:hypothetical protein